MKTGAELTPAGVKFPGGVPVKTGAATAPAGVGNAEGVPVNAGADTVAETTAATFDAPGASRMFVRCATTSCGCCASQRAAQLPEALVSVALRSANAPVALSTRPRCPRA